MLGMALVMECMSRFILLEAAIVTGNLSAYVGEGPGCDRARAIPASACYKQGIGVAFKQPVIIVHVSFRAVSTCLVCLEQPHEEQANSSVEKQRANAG